jgi:hypothetical protein
MMNNQERVNQYLARQMGIYGHEGNPELPGDPDFFTPEGFFTLIKWMQKKKILNNWLSVQAPEPEDPYIAKGPCDGSWLDPKTFPEQLASYLGFAAPAQ